MRRFEGLVPTAAVMLASLAASLPASAQGPATPPGANAEELRRQVTELSQDLLEAEAEAAEIKDQQRLLNEAPQRGAGDSKGLAAKDEFWKHALPISVIDEAADAPRADVLTKMEYERDAIKKDQKAAVSVWKSAMERELALQADAARAEELFGVATGRGASQSDGGISPILVGFGLLAVLGGMILAAHEVRDRLRWRLRALGSRPSLIVAALLVPLAAACGASPGTTDEDTGRPAAKAASSETPSRDGRDLVAWRDDLKKRLEKLKQGNDAALQKLSGTLEEIRGSRAVHGLASRTPFQKKVADRATAVEAEVQEEFRKLRVAARLTVLAAAAAERLDHRVKVETDRLQLAVMNKKNEVRTSSLIRIAACGLFTVAVVVPLTRVRSRRRRERDEQGRLCPRCLNKDTLDVDDAATDAVEGLQAKFRLMVCNACEYEIRENYIVQNRLCFPTVGIRYSGKTHWLVMLYDQIKNANIPVASAIRKIPSREDARFDDLVKRLLYEGGRLDPTTLGLPYPLTFHVHDADPLGPNKTMVNLFDFAGEMRNFTIDQSEFRSRALLCEGFTLFLDPTQVAGGSAENIEQQIQTLLQFAEEMHAIRGLSAEVPIDLPIAICVSKMDLIVTSNPIGTRAVALVNELRETLTHDVDLSLIQSRSQLCARAMPMMFPGWNVERTLRENFGGRYMFFPMSAVGLEEAELGIEDLSRRTISPFGMIEPLLWLLHMHGYCVLH